MLDLSGIPIIDAHGHPFMPTREKKEYSYAYSMCVHGGLADFRYLTSYRMALQEYKRLFGLPADASEETVIACRNERASADYPAFVGELYRDAGIVSILSDFGYPITGEGLTGEELASFASATAGVCEVYDLIRIETTCDRILYRPGLSFGEILDKFESYIETYKKEHRVAGIKTVVGYYTGLGWRPVSYQEAERNYGSFYQGKYRPDRADKPFRDYMVGRGLELAGRHGLVFQIHTGAGDPPACDLRLMNPNSLYELLNTEEAGRTKIVLVHAGFPYGYEAAFLAANYPGVYTDISSTVSYLGRAAESEFRKVLDVCPHNKIMFGSDGGGFVDQSWFAANYFRRALGGILDEYVEKGCFTEAYAAEIGKMILHDNAKRVYGI